MTVRRRVIRPLPFTRREIEEGTAYTPRCGHPFASFTIIIIVVVVIVVAIFIIRSTAVLLH
jgi:uncharacterized protein YqhQ